MNKRLFLLIIIISLFTFSSKTLAEDKMELTPSAEVSSGDKKIEINPQSENPVLINKEPLKTNDQQANKLPIVSIYIQPPSENTGKSPLKTQSENQTTEITKQPLHVGVDQETKEVVIEQGETTVRTKEPINVENNTINIQTFQGKMPINVLPETVTKIALQKEHQKLEQVSIKVMNKQPIYETTGVKEEKVLNIIPVRMLIKTQISAQTGEIIAVQKPWWAKILDPISF